MNIKTKKNKLTKILIGSSLLLSTISLPLALTSCSKNKSVSNEDKEQQKNLTSYLFNLDNPQLLDDKDNKPIENKDTLFLKDNVKNLANDLKTKDGYNIDFLTKLYNPIEKIYQQDENGQYFEVNDLGEIVVHYLNSSLVAGKCLSFAVNEEVFSGFDKFDDIKNHISCNEIKYGEFTVDSKPVKGFEKNKENKEVKFFTFDKTKNTDQLYDEKNSDAKVNDIKKIKIDLNDTSSNGFLITFKPAKGEGNKTIIFKYVDDKEVKLYKKEFYDNFEEKKVEEIVDDFFITCDINNWGKYIGTKFDSADDDIKKKFSEKELTQDATQDATNAKLLSEITSDNLNLAGLGGKLDDFLGLLNETKLLDFVIDVKKSKEKNTLCLDQNSLPTKVQFDSKDVKYLLCINDSLKTKIESDMKIDITITNNDKNLKPDMVNHTLNVVLNPDDLKNDGLVNLKLTCKSGDNNFWSKEIKKIEIKFNK